jgi:two-component system, cell cycle response regulator
MSRERLALVVDDDPEIAAVLQMILELQGLQVLTAADGEAALQIVQAQPVDIVFSDVVMPKLRGDELCQRLKSDPVTAHLPVVLVSSLPPERVRDGHADALLQKPFALAQIVGLLHQLLP